MKNLIALVSGVLFAVGLGISGMSDPWKVRAFLDVGGAWDPSLMFVMAGALAVFATAFQLSKRRSAPLYDVAFHLPEKRKIDAPLLAGAALFGAGWGLSGFCPGPALFAIASGREHALLFVGAFLASAWLTRYVLSAPWSERKTPERVAIVTSQSAAD